MGNRVNRVKTPVSESQMAQAILEGWRELFGTIPTKEQVAIILSQNSLETANRKSMWNFNIGNITTNGKGSYNYFDNLSTKEQVKPGKWVPMNLKYRAYPSLKEGMKDYLKFINKKYPAAWQNIVNPNPAGFSKALKQKGYYTANEAPYTKSLVNLYNQHTKSNSYEVAMSGKVQPVGASMLAPKNNKSIDSVLDNYIKMIAATEKNNKKLYKKFLTYNDAVIVINANNFTDGTEFARILCAVLEEELLAKAHIHTDGNNIEIECSIPGPNQECFEITQGLIDIIAEAFSNATKKIGNIKITSQLITNKRSSYKPITFKVADSQYRQFLLKFV